MFKMTFNDSQMLLIGDALRALPEYPVGFWHDPYDQSKGYSKVFEGPAHREMCKSLAPGIHRRLQHRFEIGKTQYEISFPAHELAVIELAVKWYEAGPQQHAKMMILQSVQPKLLAC